MAKCRHAFDRSLWVDRPVFSSHGPQIETTCATCGGFIGRRWASSDKPKKKAGASQDAEEHTAAEKRAAEIERPRAEGRRSDRGDSRPQQTEGTIPVITIVTGLGRCGLSAVMQMLDAAGFPVLGTFPAYKSVAGPVVWTELVPHRGAAVKIVDPVRHSRINWQRSDLAARVILCRRGDYAEQARSALAATALSMPGFAGPNGPDAVAKVAATYGRDNDRCAELVERFAGGRIHHVLFEDLIGNPRGEAARIADFMELPDDVIPAMAAQIRYRSAFCQNLAIEARLTKFGRLRTPAEAIADP